MLTARCRENQGIHVLELDLTFERSDEEVDADRAHQRLGEGVVDQPFAVGEHTLRGHHRRGGTSR